MTIRRPTQPSCAFDPNLCPLLQGLTAEEQQARMESDPIIRACVQSIAGGGAYPVQCGTIQDERALTESTRKPARRDRARARA